MTGPHRSLTHTEALARFEQLAVTSYDVRLDLAVDDATFGSVTTIVFESSGGPTFVDLKPARVNDIRLNGKQLGADELDRGRMPLLTQAGTNELVVDAVMGFRNDGEGLHRSVDPADGRHYVYGMSFMDAAPSIFACFDQPDLKAPYTFHVIAPEDWVVIGNAPVCSSDPGPGSTTLWELETTQPLSTYFVTLVAGPYHVLRDQHDGIPLGLSARASIAEHLDADADELFTMTRQCFDEFHRLFGIRYPYGDYHQAFVPEFNAGAMENPGCVTFRDTLVFTSRVTRGARAFRATTVSHEMAHQWFGNIVTPKWWDDLWLNESFAEYLGNRVATEVTEYADAPVHLSYARRHWGLVADQSPSTHPVAGNGAVDATSALQDFDGISYTKGSSVLKQLNTAIGDPAFFGGTLDHFTRHRFGNATMTDLFASWERAGAGDLSAFTENWLRTAGPDSIRLDRRAGALRRITPPEHPADRPHTFRVALAGDDGWTTQQVDINASETAYVATGPVVLDPYEDTWADFHLDEETVSALPGLLPGVEDDMLLATIWAQVRNGLRNARLDPRDVVDLLEARLPVEDTETTLRHVMPWVFGTVLAVAPPGSAERIHRAARSRLEGAEVGSELQLSAFRAAVDSASDVELLRGWLAGPPAGIEVDLDVRWRILVRLAVLGATDVAELGAELAAAPTAITHVEHTRARASLPTAEAKEFAWQRFSGEVDVSNYELEAAGLGMWRGGQERVTTAYVDRYFAELPGTVEVRSGWLLADAAEMFYPVTSLTQSTLDAARTLIDDPGLDPSLRRRVVDAADHTARMLAVRRAFPV